jgi:hypothetical protein
VILLTLSAVAAPGQAGVFFGKKNKPNPAERVPELIVTVKTDKDEGKRAAAAEELRQYDPAAHKDIVPILIDVLLNDPKPSVRSEAAESLGKIRPISQEAGWALEQALEKDTSMRVRLRARYALLGYHWNGYQSPNKDKGNPPAEKPDKGGPSGAPPVINTVTPPTPGKAKSKGAPILNETPPPPLAEPGSRLEPRPLPPGPPKLQPVPAASPKLQPAPARSNDGPALEPPRF